MHRFSTEWASVCLWCCAYYVCIAGQAAAKRRLSFEGVHRQRRRGVALWRRALLRPGSERNDLLGDPDARRTYMGVEVVVTSDVT